MAQNCKAAVVIKVQIHRLIILSFQVPVGSKLAHEISFQVKDLNSMIVSISYIQLIVCF